MSAEIAIEWFRDRIDILSAVGASARLESLDHADPLVPAAQAGESLRAMMAREGLPAGKAVVVLPREAVVVRRLKVPIVPENELPEIVRFQAAGKTSAPIDSLALDYLPLIFNSDDEGRDVITVTLDQSRMTRIQAVCAAAGLEIERVTISPLGIGQLVRLGHAVDLGISGPDLVVYQQGSLIELSIFDQGTLVFCHSMQLPDDIRAETLKPLSTELTRSLMALSQTRPDATVTRCYYVCGAPHPAVADFLTQRFGAGFHAVADAPIGRMQSPGGFEALAGALLPKTDPSLALDLLHPRKKIDAPDRTRLYLGLSAAAAMLLLGGGGFWFYSTKSALEADAAALQAEVDKAQELIKKGKPRADAFARVAKWKDSDSSPVELWTLFRKELPESDRMYFIEMKIVPGPGEMAAKYLGRGQAKDRSDIDALNQALSDHGFRVKPTVPTLGNRDPDYPWQFDLDVDLPRYLIPESAPPVKPAVVKK